jgi:hypothetical protein
MVFTVILNNLPWLCWCAVGMYEDLRTAIRERDLAVLAVHGRKERNRAAPATLLPGSSYSDQEVAATAVKLQQRVRRAWACAWGFDHSTAWLLGGCACCAGAYAGKQHNSAQACHL